MGRVGGFMGEGDMSSYVFDVTPSLAIMPFQCVTHVIFSPAITKLNPIWRGRQRTTVLPVVQSDDELLCSQLA